MTMRDRRGGAPVPGRAPLLPYLIRIKRNIKSYAQLYIDQRRRRIMASLADGTVLEVASIDSDTATKGDILAHTGDRFTAVGTTETNQVLLSKPLQRGGVEWSDISDAMPFGGLSHEMLVRKNSVVTDILPLVQGVTMDRVILWTDTGFASAAGTYTLEIQKNGVNILSGLFNLESLTLLTPTALMFASSTSFVNGDYITMIARSNNADLTGCCLRVIFNF